MPVSIAAPCVLLVEGQDEVRFFQALLRHLGLLDVQVVEVGGKDKFPQELPTLLNDPGFSAVRAYAIVRDADQDAGATFQSVQGLLMKHGQPAPGLSGRFESSGRRKVGVFILPGNRDEGVLEDLCLETVQTHPVVPCIGQFFTCLEMKIEKRPKDQPADAAKVYFPKHESKARVLAFLAAMHETVNKLGEAAERGYWQFDHPALDNLRVFLGELAS